MPGTVVKVLKKYVDALKMRYSAPANSLKIHQMPGQMHVTARCTLHSALRDSISLPQFGFESTCRGCALEGSPKGIASTKARSTRTAAVASTVSNTIQTCISSDLSQGSHELAA